MPSLSKKKGRRRFNPERELSKAKKIINDHKEEKFLKNQANAGKQWEYGHLNSNQVMTASDKLFHKKVIQLSKSRGIADEVDDPLLRSQYNDDRNLDNFERDQLHRHQVRTVNNDDDIDPSDSELENDDKLLNTIDDEDDIFALRRHKDRQKEEKALEEEEDLQSSGDDLDVEEDDNMLAQQNDDTLDIDEQMQEEEEEDATDDDEEEPLVPEEDIDAFDGIEAEDLDEDLEDLDDAQTPRQKQKAAEQQRKKQKLSEKRRAMRANRVNMKEIEEQIMNDDDEDSKRLLNISKQLNAKRVAETNRLYDDSDGSDYYQSSDEDGITNINDFDRNHGEEQDERDDDIAGEGVGNVRWGQRRGAYYGADAANKAFQSMSEREKYRELRDEEAIAIQMQKDELKQHKVSDFMDLEMEMMMQQEMNDEQLDEQDHDEDEQAVTPKHEDATTQNKKEIAKQFSSWFNDNDDEVLEKERNGSEETEENKAESAMNIEKIQKETVKGKHADIIKRDHPELPGMIQELKECVTEMKQVYNERQRAIKKRFDDAIEDSTLFIELLRTYTSTICFYLQLKAKKVDTETMKKRGIYGSLLKLKSRVKAFRKVYAKSIEFLSNLPADWDRKEYLKQKKELLEYEKQRQEQLHARRVAEERGKQREKQLERRRLQKERAKEEKLKKKLFDKGFNRLKNQDAKLEGEDMRRGITQKIFKAQGLKRYRKQGIPRIKAKLKYEKKMKLWRKKGFKTYKGKMPNGRMEFNINTGRTHSKRLT